MRKGKIYPLNAEFQRIARKDKKVFLSEQCKKKQRKSKQWERDLQSFLFCCFLLVLFIVHLRRPSYFSLLISRTLYLVAYVFPFLPCFLLLFFLQLFVKPPQTTTLPSCISFFEMILVIASCTKLWTSVHYSSGTLPDLIS